MYNDQYKSDKLAASMSLVCVLHCLFVPSFLIAVSGTSALTIDNEIIHYLLLIITLPVSLYALHLGLKNHEKKGSRTGRQQTPGSPPLCWLDCGPAPWVHRSVFPHTRAIAPGSGASTPATSRIQARQVTGLLETADGTGHFAPFPEPAKPFVWPCEYRSSAVNWSVRFQEDLAHGNPACCDSSFRSMRIHRNVYSDD